jgi:hypothetical protein
MDAKGHERICYFVVVYDRGDSLGGYEELTGLCHPARTSRRGAALRLSHGLHAACAAPR